jgi:hypothetical protein
MANNIENEISVIMTWRRETLQSNGVALNTINGESMSSANIAAAENEISKKARSNQWLQRNVRLKAINGGIISKTMKMSGVTALNQWRQQLAKSATSRAARREGKNRHQNGAAVSSA